MGPYTMALGVYAFQHKVGGDLYFSSSPKVNIL